MIIIGPFQGQDMGLIPISCSNGLVSQLAEEVDSKPIKCEFKSHRDYHNMGLFIISPHHGWKRNDDCRCLTVKVSAVGKLKKLL